MQPLLPTGMRAYGVLELLGAIGAHIDSSHLQMIPTGVLFAVFAALAVTSTVLVSVLERQRDFGMMAAIGLAPPKLARMAMLEVVFATVPGWLLGLLLGYALVWVFSVYNILGYLLSSFSASFSAFGLGDQFIPAPHPSSLRRGYGRLCGAFCAAASGPPGGAARARPRHAGRLKGSCDTRLNYPTPPHRAPKICEVSEAVADVPPRRLGGPRGRGRGVTETILRTIIVSDGVARSLIRVVVPSREAGQAFLQDGDNLFLYNPRLRRSLPPSAQSDALGSDLLYSDLSGRDLETDYRVELTCTDAETVELSLTPRPDRPDALRPRGARLRRRELRASRVHLFRSAQDLGAGP